MNFFRQLSQLRRYERILVEIVMFERGVGHFERKFQGGRRVAQQRLLASENKSLCDIMWRCLRDPTFSRFDTIWACDSDRHTDTHTHTTTTASTRA